MELPRPAIYAIPSTDGTSIFMVGEYLSSVGTPLYANYGPTSHEREHTGLMQVDGNTGAYIVTFEGLNPQNAAAPWVSITTTVGTSGTVELGRSDMALRQVQGDEFTTVVARDNAVQVEIPPGALPNTYLIIMDMVTPPGAPPEGHRLRSQAYSIRPSGAITRSLGPVLLSFYYDPALLGGTSAQTLSLFQWDDMARQWRDLESEPVFDPNEPANRTAHLKAVEHFGAFALMTGPTWRDAFQDTSGLAQQQDVDLLDGARLGLLDDATEGYAVSTLISATQPFTAWGQLRYTSAIPAGTSVTVDILADDGSTVLLANVANGASLATIDTVVHKRLRLRATLRTQQVGVTPSLDSWAVTWRPALENHTLFLPLIPYSGPSRTRAPLAYAEQIEDKPRFASLPTVAQTTSDGLGCDPPPISPINWQTLRTISDPALFSIAPDIAIDSADHLHAVWFGGENSLEDANLLYATKASGSQTWSTPVAILPPNSQAWYPALAIDGQDTLHLIWYHLKLIDFQFTSDIQYAFKARGGAWSAPVYLSNSGTVRNGPNLELFAEANGSVHVVWSAKNAGNDEIFYTAKPSGQTAWQTPVQISHTAANSASPSVVVDSQGAAHVAWNDMAGTADIYYTSKPAVGLTWHEPVNVSRSSAASLWPALVIDSRDSLHLVWQETALLDNQDKFIALYYNSKLTNTEWPTPTQELARSVIPAAHTENVQAPALAVGALDALHIAWTSMADYKVYYLTKPDADAGWSTAQAVATVIPPQDPTDNYLTALAADRQGAVHLLWGDMLSIINFSDIIKYTSAPAVSLPTNHVLVLDQNQQAVSGACIYQNGQQVGTTNIFWCFPPAKSGF